MSNRPMPDVAVLLKTMDPVIVLREWLDWQLWQWSPPGKTTDSPGLWRWFRKTYQTDFDILKPTIEATANVIEGAGVDSTPFRDLLLQDRGPQGTFRAALLLLDRFQAMPKTGTETDKKKKARQPEAERLAAQRELKKKLAALIADLPKNTKRQTVLVRFRAGGGRIRKQTFDAIMRELGK